MQPIVPHTVVSSVGQSVWSVTIAIPAKMAEAIEMPFGMWTRVSPENSVSDEGPDPYM